MTAFRSHTAPQMFGPVIDWFTNHSQGNFSCHLPNHSLQWVQILMPPSAGTFLEHWPQFIVQWIEVWAGGRPIIRIDEIRHMLLRPFLPFFTLRAGTESCRKHHLSSSMNTVSFKGGKTLFNMAQDFTFCFYIDVAKMNLGCTRVQNSHQTTTVRDRDGGGLMTILNHWGIVFSLTTTFGKHVVILAIEFLLDTENLFIGKQNLVVFSEFFSNFCAFHTYCS